MAVGQRQIPDARRWLPPLGAPRRKPTALTEIVDHNARPKAPELMICTPPLS